MLTHYRLQEDYMGGVRLVTLRGDVTEAGGAMVGGSKRKMAVSFGGGIKGASEIERISAEIAKLTLMSETVNEAIIQSRKDQQAIRQSINALTEGDQAVRLQEWRAEIKQARANHNRSLGAIAEIEKKLFDLESAATSQINQLDESKAIVGDFEIKIQEAKQKLELASPEHLKDRLHQAEIKRIDAESTKSKSQTIIDSGSEHKELLNDRVVELSQRQASINQNIIKRSEMIDELQASIATDSIELKLREDERTQLLEENKGLEDERIELVDERASLRTELTQKSTDSQSRRRLSDEIGRNIINKNLMINELITEMNEIGINLQNQMLFYHQLEMQTRK